MRIVPIACLKDNYAYIVASDDGAAAIVDASEAAPVREAMRRAGVRAHAIWSTHHHWDHVGGNEELSRELALQVVGHSSDKTRVPALSRAVDTGDVVGVGDIEARCIHVPGHTLGAVAYFVDAAGGRAVFTGDTLFSAGCGRLFEGTPAQMYASLARLLALPGDTRLYCGHEYTESNLRFAAYVEPSNGEVTRARARAASLRAQGVPTMGTTLAEEKGYNPFLRVDSTELRATLGILPSADAVTAFAAIRAAKDSFR